LYTRRTYSSPIAHSKKIDIRNQQVMDLTLDDDITFKFKTGLWSMSSDKLNLGGEEMQAFITEAFEASLNLAIRRMPKPKQLIQIWKTVMAVNERMLADIKNFEAAMGQTYPLLGTENLVHANMIKKWDKTKRKLKSTEERLEAVVFANQHAQEIRDYVLEGILDGLLDDHRQGNSNKDTYKCVKELLALHQVCPRQKLFKYVNLAIKEREPGARRVGCALNDLIRVARLVKKFDELDIPKTGLQEYAMVLGHSRADALPFGRISQADVKLILDTKIFDHTNLYINFPLEMLACAVDDAPFMMRILFQEPERWHFGDRRDEFEDIVLGPTFSRIKPYVDGLGNVRGSNNGDYTVTIAELRLFITYLSKHGWDNALRTLMRSMAFWLQLPPHLFDEQLSQQRLAEYEEMIKTKNTVRGIKIHIDPMMVLREIKFTSVWGCLRLSSARVAKTLDWKYFERSDIERQDTEPRYPLPYFDYD